MASTTVRYDFVGRDVSAGRTAGEVDRKFGALGRTVGAVGKTFALAIGGAAVGGVAALGAAMVKGVKDAQTYQTLALKTAAVIKSTGNVANISVKGVQSLAASLENLSGVDEELIINSQNVLATFTRVRNETGKSNDIFNQATKAALNMSTALGTDLQSATIQVGKALNDPIKGITALQRVGVSFTQKQRDQIKALVESGKTMEAQKLILKELNTEFGGAAEAAGKGFAGSVARAKDAAGDFARDLGTRALPKLTEFADWFAVKGVPKMREFATYVEQTLIPNVVSGFRDLKTKVERALPDIDWSVVGKGLKDDATSWAGELIAGVKTGLDKGDWKPLGSSLGTGLGRALSSAVGVGSSIGKAVIRWAGEVDWYDVGEQVGKKSFPFAIGFVSHMTDELVKTAKEHPLDTAFAALFFLGVGRIAGKIKNSGSSLAHGFTGAFFKAWYYAAKPFNDAIDWFFRLFSQGFRRGFRRLFGEASDNVGKSLRRLGDGIAARALYMHESAVKMIHGLIKGIGDTTASVIFGGVKLIGRLLALFARSGTWLVSRGVQLIGGLLRGIAGTSVGRTIGGVINRLVSPFRSAGRWLITEGAQVVIGLLTGIGARMRGVAGWIKGAVVDPIIRAVKNFFGIKSPSTVMAGLGAHLISGLEQGMLRVSPGAVVRKVFGGFPSALGALVTKGLVNIRSLPRKAWDALSGLGGKFAGMLDGIGNFLSGGRGGGSIASLVAFGRWLQSMGYRVSEHPAFGGVAPVHVPGSLHYKGMAIDVNTRPGMSSQEQAELARIIGPAHTAGFRTIFMAPGHYDHAHISLYSGGLVTEPVFGVGRSGRTYSFAERGTERVLSAAQTMSYGRGGTVVNEVTNVYLDGVALGDTRVTQMVARAVKDARRSGHLHSADFK